MKAIIFLAACAATAAGCVEAADDPEVAESSRACQNPYLNAQPGDLIDVRLGDLHPTQAVLGYDEVYYKLGRYRSNKDELAGAFNKRFQDWCESNGQGTAASVSTGARLDQPGSFTCTVPIGSESAATLEPMKTAVIGPHGDLYLTDGHHTFTAFWETPDGGPDVHIRVRVLGNLHQLGKHAFWQTMKAHGWTWLRDADDEPIARHDLPDNLGIDNFEDDPYRSALYFARDIGYAQEPVPFQEFYWGRWMRQSDDPGLDLGAYDLDDQASYVALVTAISQRITALADGAVVSDGKTAIELGKLPAVVTSELTKLAKPMSNAKPGKLAFALDYRLNP